MSEIDIQIKNEIYWALSLLGGKSDILGTVGSWKDTMPDEDILSCLKLWNEWKRKELSERLSSGGANDI